VTVDCTKPRLVAEFWAALLDRQLSVPLPGWLRLGTLGEAEPVINFQPVAEPKRDKTRMHFDIRVDDVDQAVDTVTRLGGRSLQKRYDYDEGIVLLMADPEGNEFCLVHYFADGATVPSMTVLNDAARSAITSGKLAHLVTLNPDGGPQLSAVWVGLDGDEIVSGHMGDRQKLRNVRRDPRVVLSIETGVVNGMGLAEYLVVYGSGTVVAGDAAGLLQRLAHVYLGPDVTFPPGENHPTGLILRVTPERIGGVGPWSSIADSGA
jgi:PPOX class probable F420-dependent enzyme